MKTIRTMMLTSLGLAMLAMAVSGAEARGFGGGSRFGGRGIAVGEPRPGGFGRHHGGWGHHGRFRRIGWDAPAGGYFLSSYSGFGPCELLFSPRRGRYVRACD